jgi:hypothetical protein
VALLGFIFAPCSLASSAYATLLNQQPENQSQSLGLGLGLGLGAWGQHYVLEGVGDRLLPLPLGPYARPSHQVHASGGARG